MSLADLARFEMKHVPDVTALCALMHDEHAAGRKVVLLAGGTDYMVELSQGAPIDGPLPLVVDISRMSDLRGISFDGATLRIGAAATYLELQRHAAILRHAPAIAAMTYDVGGPTIQARGTLGGNLATGSPAADGVAAIAAYDPTLVLRSVRGERRIGFAELQTGYKRDTRAPDEIFAAIEIAPPDPGASQIWRKVGTRSAQAISKVAMAAVAEVDEGVVGRFGLALASVAPVTALMPATRDLVSGAAIADLDAAVVDAAVETDVSPIDDIRSTRAYRLHVAKAVVRDFLRGLGATF
ncbi:MAG TPA: FAD-binding protein [Polyangiaceae bacterium]|nr:FAD-binding protein [Polyangiaceae bacterium]